ncbi:MAG: RHS repeat-associated core domain-containing protein [Gemmatimonadetes bacterium]|nr:RHS repeat-associated core domain-containing protein [Gemmatimonadota bacterium]
MHVGWTGRETDPETGLSFHRARYYSPELRRWTQEDPIGYGGGQNLYAYVGGAVLEGRDPSGLIEDLRGGAGSGWRSRSVPSPST